MFYVGVSVSAGCWEGIFGGMLRGMLEMGLSGDVWSTTEKEYLKNNAYKRFLTIVINQAFSKYKAPYIFNVIEYVYTTYT